MGIDSQGSNRGKCSCGECVEFVRGSGVLCGYCECVPVRHEKVTDPNSSTTSTTQDGQTTQPKKKTSGMMSHLDGSQIQKAIILAFPIPFWQNSTRVFGRHVH